MMAPDYAHWHGMSEVGDRFYMHLIPEAREICVAAKNSPQREGAERVLKVIDEVLQRPEHQWFEKKKQASAENGRDEKS